LSTAEREDYKRWSSWEIPRLGCKVVFWKANNCLLSLWNLYFEIMDHYPISCFQKLCSKFALIFTSFLFLKWECQGRIHQKCLQHFWFKFRDFFAFLRALLISEIERGRIMVKVVSREFQWVHLTATSFGNVSSVLSFPWSQKLQKLMS